MQSARTPVNTAHVSAFSIQILPAYILDFRMGKIFALITRAAYKLDS